MPSRSPGSTSPPASSASRASDRARLAADLARIDPREVLLSDALFADAELAAVWRGVGAAATPLSAAFFDSATAGERLAAYFGVASLDGFGAFSRVETAAAAAALAYVEKTQLGGRPPLSPPLARSCRRHHAHRRRHPRQSRAGRHALRRAPGQPDCRHRPHGHRRRRPPARPPAGRSLDRPGGDFRPARCGRLDAGRFCPARCDPRGARRRPRSLPRPVAPEARPRRPARPCRHRRGPCRCRRGTRRAGRGRGAAGRTRRRRRSAGAPPGDAAGGARLRRSPTTCRT